MRKQTAGRTNKTMWSTDDVMKTTYRMFLRDMRRNLGDPEFLLSNELALRNIAEFREKDVDLVSLTTPYRYKAKAQASSLFKRYIAADDKFTAKQLDTFGRDKFSSIQTHASKAMWNPVTTRSFVVLQTARKIVKDILGPFDSIEHEKLCYFGKRSVLGTKYAMSYLDVKVMKLTGSPEHISWFRKALERDELLLRSCKGATYEPAGYLELQTVPKSWKISRTMLANTCIGNFYTGGIGRMIVKRIDSNIYKLSRRPERHKEFAQKFSRTRSHVTADLSSASDLFTSPIIKRLVPYDWYKALNFGRIKDINAGDGFMKLASFMTMGIGYTFPLQSLLFYAILEAIRRLSGLTGTISAFGDDLIYPSKMHTFVSQIFGDIGFILNKDKTFVKEQFRESCGNDFYYGHDVRPFQPEGEAALLSKHDYLAYLYKTINGWLKRWEKEEIPLVYNFLICEIQLHTEKVHQVPKDFPDYSGVQTKFPILDRNSMFRGIRRDTNLSFCIDTIGVSRHLRRVPVQTIYLWNDLRLRSITENMDGYEKQNFLREMLDNIQLTWKFIDRKGRGSVVPPSKVQPKHLSSGWVRLIPHVTDKAKGLRFVSTVTTTPRWYKDQEKTH